MLQACAAVVQWGCHHDAAAVHSGWRSGKSGKTMAAPYVGRLSFAVLALMPLATVAYYPAHVGIAARNVLLAVGYGGGDVDVDALAIAAVILVRRVRLCHLLVFVAVLGRHLRHIHSDAHASQALRLLASTVACVRAQRHLAPPQRHFLPRDAEIRTA